MLCGKPHEHLVLRVAPRTCFLGSTAPKKNKRGKRSKQKQEERVLKGLHKRQEAQQARAEARFPELLGRSNSTEGQARTVVLEGDSVEKPKKTVPEACSSCDERTAKNRPVASSFALPRLRRSKPLPKLPQAFPEVPDQEILEEEEEVPLLDSPNRDGSKRPDGDGESTHSLDCNYRSSNQYPAELRACKPVHFGTGKHGAAATDAAGPIAAASKCGTAPTWNKRCYCRSG